MRVLGNKETIYLHKEVVITATDIKSVTAFPAVEGPAIGLKFNAKGRKKIAKMTANNQGRRMAIVVDGVVITAPRIMEPIREHATIFGYFSMAEAEELARKIRQSGLGDEEDAKDGGERVGGKKEHPGGENARAAAVRKVLPVGRVTVDAMEPDFSPRQVELSQRLAEAARKDPAWFREHLTKRAAPGEPLPYDPRLGLSKEEYDELNKLNARRPTLRKAGQATLAITRRGEDVYVLDGGRTLPELTGIEVDLKRDVVRTPRGVAAERFETKANPSQPSPPGPWSGVGWKLAVKGDANFVGAKIVQLTVGKAEESNRGVLYFKLLTPQERADIFLLYDLPKESK
jgi:hypothetical protein